MKILSTLLTLLFIITVCNSCQKDIDIEKEKEAIKAVILEESYAYCDRDFDRVAATYTQDKYNIRMVSAKIGYLYLIGWDNYETLIKDYIEKHPEPDPRRAELIDCIIKVYDNAAWATFMTDQGNIGARFLEKIKGEWKIAFLGGIDVVSYQDKPNQE